MNSKEKILINERNLCDRYASIRNFLFNAGDQYIGFIVSFVCQAMAFLKGFFFLQ